MFVSRPQSKRGTLNVIDAAAQDWYGTAPFYGVLLLRSSRNVDCANFVQGLFVRTTVSPARWPVRRTLLYFGCLSWGAVGNFVLWLLRRNCFQAAISGKRSPRCLTWPLLTYRCDILTPVCVDLPTRLSQHAHNAAGSCRHFLWRAIHPTTISGTATKKASPA